MLQELIDKIPFYKNNSSLQRVQMNNSIVGAWKLIQFEFKAEDGKNNYPLGKEAIGSFIYTDTLRFSGQLMRSDRPRFLIPDQMRATPAEMELAYKGIISYFGSYTVDFENKIITHFVEGSIFPNMEGTQQVRYFELHENTLQLTTPTFKLNGDIVKGILVWQKIT
jgi:hypothetical protein